MDWQKLATTVAAVIAAVATVAAAIAAAIAARQTRTAAQANVRTADYMRDQWEADKRAREQERHERLTNLLRSVRSEMDTVLGAWERQVETQQDAVPAPKQLATWEVARGEIAASFPDVADVVGRVAMIVEVLNTLSDMLWPGIQRTVSSPLTSWHSEKDRTAFGNGVRANMREGIPALRRAIEEIDKALGKLSSTFPI